MVQKQPRIPIPNAPQATYALVFTLIIFLISMRVTNDKSTRTNCRWQDFHAEISKLNSDFLSIS